MLAVGLFALTNCSDDNEIDTERHFESDLLKNFDLSGDVKVAEIINYYEGELEDNNLRLGKKHLKQRMEFDQRGKFLKYEIYNYSQALEDENEVITHKREFTYTHDEKDRLKTYTSLSIAKDMPKAVYTRIFYEYDEVNRIVTAYYYEGENLNNLAPLRKHEYKMNTNGDGEWRDIYYIFEGIKDADIPQSINSKSAISYGNKEKEIYKIDSKGNNILRYNVYELNGQKAKPMMIEVRNIIYHDGTISEVKTMTENLEKPIHVASRIHEDIKGNVKEFTSSSYLDNGWDIKNQKIVKGTLNSKIKYHYSQNGYLIQEDYYSSIDNTVYMSISYLIDGKGRIVEKTDRYGDNVTKTIISYSSSNATESVYQYKVGEDAGSAYSNKIYELTKDGFANGYAYTNQYAKSRAAMPLNEDFEDKPSSSLQRVEKEDEKGNTTESYELTLTYDSEGKVVSGNAPYYSTYDFVYY